MTKPKPSAKKTAATKTAIADVAQPGQSAPAATSRAVIVTNRPVIKDPQLAVPVDAAELPAVGMNGLASVSNKKLKPLSAPPVPGAILQTPTKPIIDNSSAPHISDMIARAAKKQAPDSAKPPVSSAEPAPAAPDKPDESDETKPQHSVSPALKTKPETTASEPVKTDPEVVQESDEKSETTPDKTNEAVRENEAISLLIDSKKYYLPINALEKRRTKRFIALGVLLSLVLLMMWVDIALDAGLVELGTLKPVTHFF